MRTQITTQTTHFPLEERDLLSPLIPRHSLRKSGQPAQRSAMGIEI